MQLDWNVWSHFPLFCVRYGVVCRWFVLLTFERAALFYRKRNTKNWIIGDQLEFGSWLNQTISMLCIIDGSRKPILNDSIDYWIHLFDAFDVSQNDLFGCHLNDQRKTMKVFNKPFYSTGSFGLNDSALNHV